MPLRRKKWTEEEERCLIERYGEMCLDGSLSKMKTREKKYRPIAAHVNALHYSVDPSTYPFQWSWKDASTKVQNMRHQYLLVKHKIRRHRPPQSSDGHDEAASVEDLDEFDWIDGLSYWPNFLRYKGVFGDHPLEEEETVPEAVEAEEMRRRRRRRRRRWGAVDRVMERWRLMEERAEERERAAEEAEGRRRGEDEKVEEAEEREWRRRLGEEEEREREWEERAERRRVEWRVRMEEAAAGHRAAVERAAARAVEEQRGFVGQVVGIVGQWAAAAVGGGGGGGGGGDDGGSPFVSDMVHHLNGIVHVEHRMDGHDDDDDDDQFIVDDG
ncbi:hypothetical protein QJS04_geneDACA004495 [Acorus gramineus]|uniref:Uncharacterized protein n=1 Tax=Acorus gramineus TaxID=55184 RepID=A0AAV9B385_ACOGR|nr:hypothetical protein QJS04_geneDACA004495 [Acorus gramineus]